jgi:hypothetical protein
VVRSRGRAFEHNTCLHTGNIVTAEGEVHTGFVFRNNIVLHNDCGVTGAGKAPGRSTLDAFFRRSVDQRGDYRLAKSSRYTRAATDGKDAGVDFSKG